MLLAVPNVAEGRDREAIATIRGCLEAGPELLDVHSDTVHNRSVFTLAGRSGSLADALPAAAGAAVDSIDMRAHRGAHPCIGALDVCPVVYPKLRSREPARRSALEIADRIAEARGVPVFLYGELASSLERRERSFFRRGGLAELTRRMRAGELTADRGPHEPHPTAGATMVTARPPLAAFNVVLDTPDLDAAAAVAGNLRESGGGLPGVRAMALQLEGGRTQVSTNVHDPVTVPLARVVAEVERLAARHGARPVAAELIGLVPEGGMEGFPADLPLAGFEPDRHLIERRLAHLG